MASGSALRPMPSKAQAASYVCHPEAAHCITHIGAQHIPAKRASRQGGACGWFGGVGCCTRNAKRRPRQCAYAGTHASTQARTHARTHARIHNVYVHVYVYV